MSGELFPGQTEDARFSLEQLKCLASAARAEVFWNTSARLPRSISEIAESLGRSPSATAYHVAELVEAGLVIPVGERKKRSRTEKLYVVSSISILSTPAEESDEYRQALMQGYAAMLRLMLRERTEVTHAFQSSPELAESVTFRRNLARIPLKKAATFRKRLSELINEFSENEGTASDLLFAMTVSLAPTLVESRRINGKIKKSKSDP